MQFLKRGTLPFSLLLFCILTTVNIQAQQRCASDEKMEALFQTDQEFARDHLQNQISKPQIVRAKDNDVITIPVHVIIVHPPGQDEGTGDNLSLERIQSQIDVLNEDFRRLNSDAGNTPSEFPTADCMIEFCLAIYDESGNDTDGVTRYETTLDFDDNEFFIKSATGWDRDDYLNIWVAPTIDALGFAYLPTPSSLPNATLDGLAIWTGTFGGPGQGSDPPYDLGRTATHEAGHYLGLRHMWGNGGCGSDDNIDDTPVSDSEYFGCPNHPSVSCGTNDMFMNYMDYVNDACMNAFTPGQSDYMNTILNTSRSSLLTAAEEKCEGAIPELSGEILSQTDVSCFGGNDGSVTVMGIDGVPPYNYSLDGGDFNFVNTFNDLSAGTYTITIIDQADQTFDLFVTISEPDLLQIIQLAHMNISCFGENDGAVTVTGIGGTNNNPYQYSLDNGPFGFNNVFLNLSPGIHSFTVKDDNECTASIDVFISEPEELSIQLSDIDPVSCFGMSDGTAIVSIDGGSPDYTIILDGNIPVNNDTITDLSPGNHSIDVTDMNGCAASTTFNISEPDSLSAAFTEISHLVCFEDSSGQISITGIGGTPGYSYSINGGPFQSDSTFSNLLAGPKQIRVRDSKLCEVVISDTLNQPDEISISIESSTEPDCFNGDNGSLTVSANGGSGMFEYQIEDQSNTDGFFSGLTSQDYSVIARDENNCESNIDYNLDQPDEITISIVSQTEAGCDGLATGDIQFNAQGGIGILSYTLNNNTNTTGFFDELASGNYTVLVTDENGCTNTMMATIEEPINFEFELISKTDNLCFGDALGSLTVMGSGNGGPFEYSLDDITYSTSSEFSNLTAGIYTVFAKDQNNCKQLLEVEITQPEKLELELVNHTAFICFEDEFGSIEYNYQGGVGPFELRLNGAQIADNSIIETAVPGTNTLVIEDNNGCTAEIEVTIEKLTEILAQIEIVQQIPCGGGDIGKLQFEAEGGLAPYEFYLDGKEGPNGYFENVSPGIHNYTILDAEGCEKTGTIDLIEGTELGVDNVEIIDITCFGDNDGYISLNAIGGDQTYTYEITNIGSNTIGEFSDLPPGDYTMNITDNTTCFVDFSFSIAEPDELVIADMDVMDEDGSDNGRVEIIVVGGTTPYMYSLDGVDFFEFNIFQNLDEGDYMVFVLDGNGCATSSEFTVGLSSSIEQLEILSELSIYPIPVLDKLTLEFIAESNDFIEISVRSIEGRKTYSSNYEVFSGFNRIVLNQENYSAGIYLIELSNKSGKALFKYIKQ